MPNVFSLPSDFRVYDRLAQTAYLERLQDVLQVFNASSGGALSLRSEAIQGDFDKSAFYKNFGSVDDRDITSNAVVSVAKIAGSERVGVKYAWKFGPYGVTEEAFKRRLRAPDEFYQLAGVALADSTLDTMIDVALGALDGAIRTDGEMLVGSGVLAGRKALIDGFRKFGDRFNRISVFVMDSGTYLDVVEQAITDKLFEEAGVVVYGGAPGTLGRPVLVTDKAPPNTIYGLQPGAVDVIESQPPGVRSYEDNTTENLSIAFRAEGAFNVNLMGYSWNVDGSPAAPSAPTKAQLTSGANWIKHAGDNRLTAGVVIDVVLPTS